MMTSVGFTETGETPEDNAPPSVSIEHPMDMRIVHGTIRISGTALDYVCLERVELCVDGQLSGTINLRPTSNTFFEFILNTTTIPNGSRTILVKAFDISNNTRNQTLTALVNNLVMI